MFFKNNSKLENDLKSQIGNLKKDLEKSVDEKIKANTSKTRLTLLESILPFLIEKLDMQIYKLDTEKTDLQSGYFYFTSSFSLLGEQRSSLYETISVNELQNLGSYKTFSIGDDTYIVAEKKDPIEKTLKKIKKSKKTAKKKK